MITPSAVSAVTISDDRQRALAGMERMIAADREFRRQAAQQPCRRGRARSTACRAGRVEHVERAAEIFDDPLQPETDAENRQRAPDQQVERLVHREIGRTARPGRQHDQDRAPNPAAIRRARNRAASSRPRRRSCGCSRRAYGRTNLRGRPAAPCGLGPPALAMPAGGARGCRRRRGSRRTAPTPSGGFPPLRRAGSLS